MSLLTLWGLIPQHVPGDVQLTPICSRLNNWCTLICVVMAVAAHFCCEYAETIPAVIKEDPSMPQFLRFTATLAFGGLFYETSWAVCVKWMGIQRLHADDPLFQRRLRLNRKIAFVFAFLTTTYTCMAIDFQKVHKGWIAEYHGGHQIVYSVRYIEWVCCAPIVLSISGQLAHGPDGKPRNGLIPSSMLTGIYCIISWQGLVVTDPYWAWGLITFAFVSYFVASYEQLYFAWYIRDAGIGGPVRAALLIYLVVMIGIYGVVYLLPIPGWISATFENKFYCVGDASFKLGTSVMLAATNDLANNQELRRRAETLADELQTLMHTASVPFFGIDVKGRITDWNMKAVELTGVPQELALGKSLMQMLGDGSQVAGSEMIRKALAGEETGTLETTLNPALVQEIFEVAAKKRIPLKKATIILSCGPRKDKLGTVKGICLVGCDLTEVAAYREAEERKVRFMAVVSHELRSPLHGIIGLMDHLCEAERDESRLRFMKLVKQCATRLLDLVVNIMEMASLVKEQGHNGVSRKLSRDPVELSKIVEEIVMLVTRSADKTGQPLVKPSVTIINNVSGLPIIEADAYKCTQVFLNILTNACKFTMEGTITLEGRADPEGAWVEVSVTDTGKGIAKQSLERIFQPFEQEDNSAVRGYQGIGLGLSIAHEVVRMHGGQIFVDSELNSGTTFTVRLPTAMQQVPVAAAKATTDLDASSEVTVAASAIAAPKEEGQAAAVSSSRGFILSVDDDVVNQEVLRGILGGDFTLQLCMSGQEALAFLTKAIETDTMPDLVLLDVMMPGMSGFEVCREIRQKLHLSMTTMPILMLSASTQDESVIEGFNSGANAYVTKPFDRQVLTAHVRSALRMKREVQSRNGQSSPTQDPGLYSSEGPNGLRRRPRAS